MEKKLRYTLHIYKVSGNHETVESDTLQYCLWYGEWAFKEWTVYKVKLWGLHKGSIEPNRPDAKALVKEWGIN